jgi:hypothetical protein
MDGTSDAMTISARWRVESTAKRSRWSGSSLFAYVQAARFFVGMTRHPRLCFHVRPLLLQNSSPVFPLG